MYHNILFKHPLYFIKTLFRSFILLILSLKYGLRTSPAQFYFYISCLFTGAFTLRSIVQRKDNLEEYYIDETNRLLYFYAIQYGLHGLLFFLNCVADTEPKVILFCDFIRSSKGFGLFREVRTR